ncbi:MAG: hypothetical protein H8F28_10185 [Fibrella sp.]|nr:hypothetical protein [Armatimonadota bacterium]
MSDVTKKELLKTIRAATAAYLDLCAVEMEARNATLAEAEKTISDEVETIKKNVDCPTACQMAYQYCINQPGANRALCLAEKTECMADCDEEA